MKCINCYAKETCPDYGHPNHQTVVMSQQEAQAWQAIRRDWENELYEENP
jgi:hypothetical protein